MEYYSAIKKEKLESFVGKWVHCEATMLSELNQTRELNTEWLLLSEKLKV